MIPGDEDLIPLKYCPRTKYGRRPLKWANKKCWNMDGRVCQFTPAVSKYCDDNDIEVDVGTKFKCVIYCGRTY